MKRYTTPLILLLLMLSISACKKAEESSKKSPSPTLVSVITAKTTDLEIREEAIGTLEGLIDPTVAAEVPARVLKVYVNPGAVVKKGDLLVQLDVTDIGLEQREAQAEVARIQALLANQNKQVERNQALVQKNFISQNAVDDTKTQQLALAQQLDAAKSRVASIAHNGSKTTVRAPVDGTVEKQLVAAGDYVKVGDPLMQIISKKIIRAHIPIPENVASKIHAGLKVRLTTPTSPDELIAEVREMKALIGSNNRAVDVTADIRDKTDWQPGASVNAVIVIGEHPNAVVVPEQSLVLRPAGEVVYIIKDGVAQQRIVKTGLRQSGNVEIVEGLQAGEVVAVDGAGFLTDKAKVNVQESKAG